MCLGMGIVRSECGDWAHSMRFFVTLGTLLLLCPLYEDSAFAEAAEHQAIEFRAEEMTRGDDQANKEAHLRSEVAVESTTPALPSRQILPQKSSTMTLGQKKTSKASPKVNAKLEIEAAKLKTQGAELAEAQAQIRAMQNIIGAAPLESRNELKAKVEATKTIKTVCTGSKSSSKNCQPLPESRTKDDELEGDVGDTDEGKQVDNGHPASFGETSGERFGSAPGYELNQTIWAGPFRDHTFECKANVSWFWCGKSVWLKLYLDIISSDSQNIKTIKSGVPLIGSYSSPNLQIPAHATLISPLGGYPTMMEPQCSSYVHHGTYRACLLVGPSVASHVRFWSSNSSLYTAVRAALGSNYAAHKINAELQRVELWKTVPILIAKEVRCINGGCATNKKALLDHTKSAMVTHAWIDGHASAWAETPPAGVAMGKVDITAAQIFAPMSVENMAARLIIL